MSEGHWIDSECNKPHNVTSLGPPFINTYVNTWWPGKTPRGGGNSPRGGRGGGSFPVVGGRISLRADKRYGN